MYPDIKQYTGTICYPYQLRRRTKLLKIGENKLRQGKPCEVKSSVVSGLRVVCCAVLSMCIYAKEKET